MKLAMDTTTSTIRWHDATQSKPDADITVLLWLDDEWCSGWWDGQEWRDAASGGVVRLVTHYADVEGP